MNHPGRLTLVFSCVCWAGVASCGSDPDPGESASITSETGESGETDAGTATAVTAAST